VMFSQTNEGRPASGSLRYPEVHFLEKTSPRGEVDRCTCIARGLADSHEGSMCTFAGGALNGFGWPSVAAGISRLTTGSGAVAGAFCPPPKNFVTRMIHISGFIVERLPMSLHPLSWVSNQANNICFSENNELRLL
jgi:hypothetical protein